MSAQFKVGDICVWQNQTGEWAYLNGVETTVTGDARPAIHTVTGEWGLAYPTDTPHPHSPREILAGDSSELRKRPPPTGEQMIRSMFDAPPVERRQPVTAWQAQFDTAQALMTMGVCVKPGKWPVEVV